MSRLTTRGHCVGVVLVLLAAGCPMVGPDFVRPSAPLLPQWSCDSRLKAGTASYRTWWRAFNDPVLEELIRRAYQQNLSLRVAGLRVLEARAQLGVVIGEIFPQTQQVSGYVDYNRLSRHSVVGLFAKQLQYMESQIGLLVAWELDFWGKFRRAIESAHASWQASLADYDSALVSLTADVASSYILIRTLEQRLITARQNAAVQEESFKLAEARFRLGSTSELDVQQATAALKATQAAIPPLQTQLRQAEHALAVLLGQPPQRLAALRKGTAAIPLAPPQVIVGIPRDLLRRRPDIRGAEYQAAAQAAQIGVAKADLYPAFSLSGSFGFLSTDVGSFKLSDMFRWSSRTIQAGPSFRWDVLNYGRLRNAVRVQDARFEQLLVSYQHTVLQAQREVEDALVAFLQAQDRAQYLTASVAAAQRAVDFALLQYRAGVQSFTTVLTAQQTLLNVQDSLATNFGQIATSLVGLYRALGGGWELREGQDLVPARLRDEMAKRTGWGKLLAPRVYNPALEERPRAGVRLPEW